MASAASAARLERVGERQRNLKWKNDPLRIEMASASTAMRACALPAAVRGHLQPRS
jgi:hypothetical protein